MENRLVFVTYKGGNCGDFFCTLLSNALGNYEESWQDHTNRCIFKNLAFVDHGIKGLEEVFRRYNGNEYIRAVDQIKERDFLKYLDWTKAIYDWCYDADRSEFIENVKHYVSSNLIVDKPNTVAAIHYYTHFEGFSLKSVYDPTVVIQLMTSDRLHHDYFYFFSKYKQSWNLIKHAPEWYNFSGEPPIVEKLPEEVTVIDSGKLFLTEDYDDEAESILSNLLGVDIKFDRDRLNRYRRDNEDILTRAFGSDYRKLSYEEFSELRKNYFTKVRNELR